MPRRRDLADPDRRPSNLSLDRLLGPRIALAWPGPDPFGAPELRISGVDAGLHLVADLPPGTDEAELQRRLDRAGLAVDVLSQHSTAPLARQALVCGYASLPETQAAAAAAVIARSTSPPPADHHRPAPGHPSQPDRDPPSEYQTGVLPRPVVPAVLL
jgi:hypothetical protein